MPTAPVFLLKPLSYIKKTFLAHTVFTLVQKDLSIDRYITEGVVTAKTMHGRTAMGQTGRGEFHGSLTISPCTHAPMYPPNLPAKLCPMLQ